MSVNGDVGFDSVADAVEAFGRFGIQTSSPKKPSTH